MGRRPLRQPLGGGYLYLPGCGRGAGDQPRYGDYSLKLFLYAFTTTTDYNEYLNIKEDVLLKIADIIKSHGGELAVHTSTVHMPDGIRLKDDGPEREPMLAGLVEKPHEK